MSDRTARLSTGLPGLDHVLDGLRPGDNTVFRVDSLEDYGPFAAPCAEAAMRAGRPVVYFRFASHQPVLPARVDARVLELHPETGLQRFVSEVIDTIEAVGEGLYLFDCLSELAVAWYSDQMLANFFMIVGPYLHQQKAVAWFALRKHFHSAFATEGIHDTAQVIMDVHRHQGQLYLQPMKVEGRYSRTMFLVHRRVEDRFEPVTSSAVLSEIFADGPHHWLAFSCRRPGIWTRAFMEARETSEMQLARQAFHTDSDACFQRLIRMALTRDPRFIPMVERYMDLKDVLAILSRMIGTGLIGGKSLGMLLARAILNRADPGWNSRLEAHDSFYIGSDVFYTFTVRNDCWWHRRRRPAEPLESYLPRAALAARKLRAGTFPEHIQRQFAEMLDYFGQSPIIVRSSSLLEDNYGNAFSGKYRSVFLTNQGSPRERLRAFINAVREVYASTMSEDALVYRFQRGLMTRDEHMALLVQRVSGKAYGDVYMPHAAGVGYSFNSYVWDRDIDPDAGLIRLVFGLGTRAVDRTDDYTRLVALNAPLKQPHGDAPDRYRQRTVDVLDLDQCEHASRRFESLSHPDLTCHLPMFATRDRELLDRARRHGLKDIFPWALTFDRLLRETGFVADMERMLKTLRRGYDHHVDIEFAVNIVEDGRYRINLLQCRPLETRFEGRERVAPEAAVGFQRRLLESRGPIIGPSIAASVDRFIYVVPDRYVSLSEQDRHGVARLIGKLTHREGDTEDTVIMLAGPGRWGTSTPSLGVPVSFSEINTVSVICEIAWMHDGLIPDISLGTHFFNDLVELGMLYLAVSHDPGRGRIDREYLACCESSLAAMEPRAERFASIVRVIDRDSLEKGLCMRLHADVVAQQATFGLAGPQCDAQAPASGNGNNISKPINH